MSTLAGIVPSNTDYMCVEPDLQLAQENDVMLARIVVSTYDEFVPVRLINVTNEPVTL